MLFLFTLFTLLLLSCSLPTDPKPVRWDFSLSLPIMQEVVPFWEPIDSLVSMDSLDGSGETSFIAGDTLAISRIDTLTAKIDLSDYLSDTRSSGAVSPGLIAVDEGDTLWLPITMSSEISNPHPDGYGVTLYLPIVSDQFNWIVISEDSPDMPFFFESSYGGSVDISLGSLEGVSSGNISSDYKSLIPYSASGEMLRGDGRDFFKIDIRYDMKPNGLLLGRMGYTFDGQLITKGLLSSSGSFAEKLISDTLHLTMEMDLVDSIEFSWALFSRADLSLQIDNPQGFSFVASAYSKEMFEDGDVWRPLDSTIIAGESRVDTSIAVDDLQVYPQWQESLFASTLTLNIKMVPQVEDSFIYYSSEDSIRILSHFDTIIYKKVDGGFPGGMRVDTDSEVWVFPHTMATENVEQVVGRLFFNGTRSETRFWVYEDSSSYLSGANSNIFIAYRNWAGESSELVFPIVLDSAKGFSAPSIHYTDELFNSFPDTLEVRVEITLEEGTTFSLNAEKEGMSIPFTAIHRQYIPLDLEIRDTIFYSTRVQSVSIPRKDLQLIRKMDSPEAELKFHFESRSPLAIELYGIGSREGDREALRQLETITPDSGFEDYPSFFSLTDRKYLTLPDSGFEATSSVVFDSHALSAFTEEDSLYFRFGMVIPKKDRALFDRESGLSVRASFHLTAIARSDSLAYWE